MADAWDKAGYYSMSLEKTLEAKIGNYCGKACQLLVSGPLDASCAKLKKVVEIIVSLFHYGGLIAVKFIII